MMWCYLIERVICLAFLFFHETVQSLSGLMTEGLLLSLFMSGQNKHSEAGNFARCETGSNCTHNWLHYSKSLIQIYRLWTKGYYLNGRSIISRSFHLCPKKIQVRFSYPRPHSLRLLSRPSLWITGWTWRSSAYALPSFTDPGRFFTTTSLLACSISREFIRVKLWERACNWLWTRPLASSAGWRRPLTPHDRVTQKPVKSVLPTLEQKYTPDRWP